MIPLWVSIPCVILTLIVICHWFLKLDIDWEDAFRGARDIAVTMVIIICVIVAIFQFFSGLVMELKESKNDNQRNNKK